MIISKKSQTKSDSLTTTAWGLGGPRICGAHHPKLPIFLTSTLIILQTFVDRKPPSFLILQKWKAVFQPVAAALAYNHHQRQSARECLARPLPLLLAVIVEERKCCFWSVLATTVLAVLAAKAAAVAEMVRVFGRCRFHSRCTELRPKIRRT